MSSPTSSDKARPSAADRSVASGTSLAAENSASYSSESMAEHSAVHSLEPAMENSASYSSESVAAEHTIASKVVMEESWKAALLPEFGKDYFRSLSDSLHKEKHAGSVIYPPGKDIFKAFELTPLKQVKVVILGQDPYHGPGQAMGLSFSVPDNVPAPPSLKNIFKEIESELGIRMSGRPNLEPWARQGVLLLNAILTVRAGVAASHRSLGWETFTDAVIRTVSSECDSVVFMLWGNFARGKAPLIDSSKHLVLEAAHPSPLARGAFFGCGHFAKANGWLVSKGLDPIDWQL